MLQLSSVAVLLVSLLAVSQDRREVHEVAGPLAF